MFIPQHSRLLKADYEVTLVPKTKQILFIIENYYYLYMVKNTKLYKRIYNEKSLFSRSTVSYYYSLKATIIVSSLFFLLYFIYTKLQ